MIATLAISSRANAVTITAPIGDAPSISACPARMIEAVKTTLPIFPPELIPTVFQLKQRIAYESRQYGLDYDQLSSVVQCESQFNPLATGDHGLAFGIAQFHEATFDQYCTGSYYNANDQLRCMARMFAFGEADNWSCFKRMYDEVIYAGDSTNSTDNGNVIQLAVSKP